MGRGRNKNLPMKRTRRLASILHKKKDEILTLKICNMFLESLFLYCTNEKNCLVLSLNVKKNIISEYFIIDLCSE